MLVATACNAWAVADNMQNKAKIVAISGICGGVAVICLLLLGLPAVKWGALILAVVASVAVAIPTIASGRVVFSVLAYVVSAIFGTIAGVANILYVAPVVAFCMPMAIVKVYAETLKISTKVEQKTIDSPFDNGDDKQVVAVEVQAQSRMKGFVKWILYYVVLEIGIALTLLAGHIFAKPTFDFLVSHNLFVVLLVALQLLPIPFDFLLRGAFIAIAKVLKRHIQQ